MILQPPKVELPTKSPTAADFPIQGSELGRILPIVYGTVRLSMNIIERDDNQTQPYAGTIQSAGATTAVMGSALNANSLCKTLGDPRQLARLVQGGVQYNIRYKSWAGSTLTLASITGRTATAGTTTTALVDSGATFVTSGILPGDLYRNITRGIVGYVVAVVGETQLTVATTNAQPIAGQVSGDSYDVNALPVATTSADTWFVPLIPTSGNPVAGWKPSTLYAVNTLIWANGNKYVATVGGTSAARTTVNGVNQSASGPTGTGGAIVDGTVTWAYASAVRVSTLALAICEGQIFGVGQAWQDSIQFAAYTDLPSINLTLFLGAPTGLARPSWFNANATQPPYANTAILMIQSLRGDIAALPEYSLEVQGVFATGTTDANPADIAIDLITHQRRGAAMPSTRVDPLTTGTTDPTSYRTYCTAFGLNVSWLIDAQTTARELLQALMEATNSEAIWTNRIDGVGGMFKFVPLGDRALTANGVTFTPNTTVAYDLSQDDFLEPLQITHAPSSDTFNSCPVEYVDRASGYMRVAVDDPDMADVDLRGLKRAPTKAFPQVLDPNAAIMVSRILAQRSLNVRNTYRVKVGWRFLLIEPGDILTLTDTVLGISSRRVRVTDIGEDHAGAALIINAQDWPAQVYAAGSYTPQSAIRS
jgi:hypothetical protein